MDDINSYKEKIAFYVMAGEKSKKQVDYEIISEDGFSKIRGLDKLLRDKEKGLVELFDEKKVVDIQIISSPFTFYVKNDVDCGNEQIAKKASMLDFKPNAYLDSDVVSFKSTMDYFSTAYSKSASFLKVKFEDD